MGPIFHKKSLILMQKNKIINENIKGVKSLAKYKPGFAIRTWKIIKLLNKTNDFMKIINSLSQTDDFIKNTNLFNKTDDFIKLINLVKTMIL